eukprot:744339-Prymnesium_polylepis.1
MAGTLPNMAGTLPNMAGTLPNMAGALPNMAGALPHIADTLPNMACALPNMACTLTAAQVEVVDDLDILTHLRRELPKLVQRQQLDQRVAGRALRRRRLFQRRRAVQLLREQRVQRINLVSLPCTQRLHERRCRLVRRRRLPQHPSGVEEVGGDQPLVERVVNLPSLQQQLDHLPN